MKEIHVNAYTKSDGTYVREHFRNKSRYMNYGYDPVIIPQKTTNYPTSDDNTSNIYKAIDIILQSLPYIVILSNAKKQNNRVIIQQYKPAINNYINQLEQTRNMEKYALDTSLKNIANVKTQDEYSNMYKSIKRQYDVYKKSTESFNRIKYAFDTENYEALDKELNEYVKIQNEVINPTLLNDNKDNENMQGARYAKTPRLITSFHARILNNLFNFNNEDARLLMDLALAPPSKFYICSDFMVIPNEFTHLVNSHLELNSKDLHIPDNWNGIAFTKNSSISIKLSEFPQLQKFILNEYNKNKFNYKSPPYMEILGDRNLHLALGNITILNPHIDENGTFHAIIFDKYDFKFIFKLFKTYKFTILANNYAWFLQLLHILKNYYILIPIEFKL